LNDYLSSDRGLSVEGATLFVLVFGLGNFVGVFIGGIGSSYLYEHHGARYPEPSYHQPLPLQDVCHYGD